MNGNAINIGDLVVYSTRGICTVKDIETQSFNRETKDYFVLVPVFDTKSTYYIPTDYDGERVHIKPALNKKEAKELLKFAKNAEPLEWISNPNERKKVYDWIYKAKSREEKIQLLKALKQHERKQKELGKRLYAADTRILNGCETLIANELAYILGKTPDEIIEIIE